eukprot:7997468-Heterocapsa_arctica.AAC.1
MSSEVLDRQQAMEAAQRSQAAAEVQNAALRTHLQGVMALLMNDGGNHAYANARALMSLSEAQAMLARSGPPSGSRRSSMKPARQPRYPYRAQHVSWSSYFLMTAIENRSAYDA